MVPLLNLPGRAGFDVNLNLYYNSKIWPLTNIFTNADYDTPSVGFRLDYGMFDYGGTIMDPDGTKHPLTTVTDVDPRYYVHYQTTDSSYIQITGSKYVGVCPGPLICQQPNLTVTFKNGTHGTYENFNFQSGGGFRPIQFTDTHGNQISISYLDGVSLHIASITDTVGRVIAFTYDSGGRLSSFGYGQHNFTFSWNQSYQLRFNFGTLTTQGPISVLTQVTRPNGTAVRFQYGDWGIVNEIDELSSSGTTRYSTAYNFPAASAGALSENPTFTTQTVFDGVSSNLQWHYAVTTPDSGVSTVAITGPTQVTTTDTLSTDGLLIERRITTGGSQNTTLWRIIEQSWGTDSSSVNSRLTARSTILENGAASGTVFASYDANGNPTDVRDYDFGTPSSANLSLSPGAIPSSFGALLREVVATYAPLSGILNRPQQILMKDGQGTTIARTDYNYDEGSGSVHGDLTSMLRYTNAAAGSGSIQTSITYDGYGNRVTMQEGCCRFTQSTFSATTNFAYPDSTSVGPQGSQLTSTYTYNADGSVATATDPTGVVLTYGYDSSGRITSVASSSGLTTSSSFDDSSLNATVRVSSNANSSAKMRTLDGIGRPIYDQRFDGTTLVSTVNYINDELGRAVQISNPYGPNAAPVYRNVLYDALDRVTQSTPPAATAGGSQNSYIAAYSGTNVLFSDPAGRERRNYTDALGRLVRVEEPGLTGGANATASLTIAGTELSASTSSGNGASSGTATVSISGSTDRSTSVLTHPATPATITVAIGGSNGRNDLVTSVCIRGVCRYYDHFFDDTGHMQYSVNAGGHVITSSAVTYNSGTGQASLAQSLAGALPANAYVTASYTGSNQFVLSTTATGVSTNSTTLSTSITSDCVPTDGDYSWTVCNQTWTITPSQNFAGGTDDIYTTFYDTGNVTVSITANGTNYSKVAAYSQNSSPNSIANDLYTQFIGDAGFNQAVRVNPPGSGTTLEFTTVATGSNTNYPLSTGAVTTSSYFATGSTSFTVSPAGSSSFTPGQNGVLYDSGTITAALTGFSTATLAPKQVSYGQGSTPAGIASLLASQIHSDPLFPVDATVSSGSATINLTARDIGVDGNNYRLTVAVTSNSPSYFTPPSFSAPPAQLSSGADPSASLASGIALVTTYSYDPQANLTQVLQGQQQRNYAYDGLGRMTSACVPETLNQCITYGYTDFGGVQQKIDPRVVPNTSTHITTTYGYDTLNRLNDIQYNDGTPEVHYTFGGAGAAFYGAGRLISSSDGTGSKSYRYAPTGQISQVSQTIGSNTYTTQYGYTNGQLTSITYPSSRAVSLGYDSTGRLTHVGWNGSSIFNISSFTDAGQPVNTSYGNGVSGSYGYNNQLQLGSIQFTGASSGFNLVYDYNGQSNNGQITGITDNINSARSQAFAYDELGRLKRAQTVDLTSPGTWKLKFGYDRYSNRLEEIPQAGTAAMPFNEVLIDPVSNRIAGGGVGYDAAGNMTADGLHSYSFDAENRIVHVDGSANTFAYDADDLRTIKNGNCYIYSGGAVIAEYPGCATAISNTPSAEYIYAGGRRIAAVANSTTTFLYPDHLSTRFSADASGQVVRTFGHFPFGEVWYETGSTDKWKFGTYERDVASEGGLDYVTERFYSPGFGRFLSIDPLAGGVGDPQSLNRTVYVADDPVNQLDPTGLSSSLDFCMLDDKGDITTTCASLRSPATTALFAFWGLINLLNSPTFLQHPNGSWFDTPVPSGDPLAVAEAEYNRRVSLVFAAIRAAKSLSGDWTDTIVFLSGQIDDDFSEEQLLQFIVDLAKSDGYKPPLKPSSISNAPSDLIQKYLKYKNPAATVPKVTVKVAAPSTPGQVPALPAAGFNCFNTDAWQVLESIFSSPVGFLDPLSGSGTTCVK